MKLFLAFIAGSSFGFVFFGLLMALTDRSLNDLGMALVPISAGIFFTSTLLFLKR